MSEDLERRVKVLERCIELHLTKHREPNLDSFKKDHMELSDDEFKAFVRDIRRSLIVSAVEASIAETCGGGGND